MRIDEIKESIDCREYIGNVVELKKGVGICPFHEDTKPSLKVFKDGYKCFACGEYGDIIDFVQKYNEIGFTDALNLLAGEHGITVNRKPNKHLDRLKRRDLYYHTIEQEVFKGLCTMMQKLGKETSWTENTYEYERILSEHIDNYLYVIEARKHMSKRDKKLLRNTKS